MRNHEADTSDRISLQFTFHDLSHSGWFLAVSESALQCHNYPNIQILRILLLGVNFYNCKCGKSAKSFFWPKNLTPRTIPLKFDFWVRIILLLDLVKIPGPSEVVAKTRFSPYNMFSISWSHTRTATDIPMNSKCIAYWVKSSIDIFDFIAVN